MEGWRLLVGAPGWKVLAGRVEGCWVEGWKVLGGRGEGVLDHGLHAQVHMDI